MLNKDDFLNAAKILRSIDHHELEAAGVALDHQDWLRFARGPITWLIRACDADAERVWGVVEGRMGMRQDHEPNPAIERAMSSLATAFKHQWDGERGRIPAVIITDYIACGLVEKAPNGFLSLTDRGKVAIDCATHNAPAFEPGPRDHGAAEQTIGVWNAEGPLRP